MYREIAPPNHPVDTQELNQLGIFVHIARKLGVEISPDQFLHILHSSNALRAANTILDARTDFGQKQKYANDLYNSFEYYTEQNYSPKEEELITAIEEYQNTFRIKKFKALSPYCDNPNDLINLLRMHTLEAIAAPHMKEYVFYRLAQANSIARVVFASVPNDTSEQNRFHVTASFMMRCANLTVSIKDVEIDQINNKAPETTILYAKSRLSVELLRLGLRNPQRGLFLAKNALSILRVSDLLKKSNGFWDSYDIANGEIV